MSYKAGMLQNAAGLVFLNKGNDICNLAGSQTL